MNAGQMLYAKALESSLKFTKKGFVLENAAIFKRNFAGRDEAGTRRDGKKFVKKGRRFSIALTDEQMSQLLQLGSFNYGKWFFDPDNSEMCLYTMEVKTNMQSDYPPTIKMFSKLNGKVNVTEMNASSMGILDSIDAERWDITVHAWEYEDGNYSLYLQDLATVALDPNAEAYSGAYKEYYAALGDQDEMPFPEN